MMSSLVASMVMLMSAQSATTSKSQPDAAQEPRQIAEAAMKFAAANDMPGMFAYFGKIGPIDPKQLSDTLTTTVSQRKTISSTFGRIIGYQFISECRRGDTFSRVLFAEKREKMAVRWEFIFYKPRDKWQLTSFFWDDKAREFFQAC